MAIPAKPQTANAPVTAETAAPVAAVASTDAAPAVKGVIKQFGPAKTADGVVIAAPTVGNLSLVDLSKKLYETVVNVAQSAGVTVEQLVEFASNADKTKFPGHKDGRILYATICTVASLAKLNGLLSKVRGAGGVAALKAKLADKDSKIEELKAQMAALMAQYGVAK